jgi:hypothetical protein
MLGMRTQRGVALKDISVEASVVERLVSAGLVALHEERLVPSARGMLFADRLPLVLE